MRIKILSPEFSREFEAQAVYLPGSQSAFEVLPGHASIVSTLAEGKLRWRGAEGEESIDIKGGVCRLLGDEMTICVEA